ncbi:hypothetical protein COOONC_21882 [Cooperia oncophora]
MQRLHSKHSRRTRNHPFRKDCEGTLILEPYATSTFGSFNVTAVSVQKSTPSMLGSTQHVRDCVNKISVTVTQAGPSTTVTVQKHCFGGSWLTLKYAAVAAKYSLVHPVLEVLLRFTRNFSQQSANFVDDENCTEGAAITAQCGTKDHTKVTVGRGHHSVSMECGPTNPQAEAKLSYDYATVTQNCAVEC